MRVKRYTEETITLEFGGVIDEQTNKKIVNLRKYIDDLQITGIIETIISYTRLVIYFDVMKTSAEKIASIIRGIDLDKVTKQNFAYRLIEIPVCYEEDFGPDLQLFKESGFQPDDVIEMHSRKEYLVFMLGFMPGFVYLGGLNEKLYKSRLETPRKRIPAGAVGIGGKQTGIYPFTSPGGWNLIGQTPVRLYDQRRGDQTILYEAGDKLIFQPISKKEYVDISEQVEKGTYQVITSLKGG